MNAEALANAKHHLKHKEAVHPEASAVPPLAPLCPDGETFLKKMKETYIETYHDAIKKFTFRTTWRVLTAAQLTQILKAHEQYQASQVKFTWIKDPEFKDLLELTETVEAAKKELGCDNIFIRLSTRSPKDASLSAAKIDQIYRAELRHLEDFDGLAAEAPDPSLFPALIDNRKMHALYRATISALKVQSGVDAVQLLVESQRIQEDIREALRDFDKPGTVPFKIIIREFRPFNVELEFRAFIMGDKLTALTQYNEMVFFPHLLYKKNYIAEVISDFWAANIKGHLGDLHDYILDVVLIPKGPVDREDPYRDLEVVVIEVNPIGEFAGSGMFRWEIPHDNEVMRGLKPFEFRIATAPLRDGLKQLPPAFAKIIATAELASPRRGSAPTNPPIAPSASK